MYSSMPCSKLCIFFARNYNRFNVFYTFCIFLYCIQAQAVRWARCVVRCNYGHAPREEENLFSSCSLSFDSGIILMITVIISIIIIIIIMIIIVRAVLY